MSQNITFDFIMYLSLDPNILDTSRFETLLEVKLLCFTQNIKLNSHINLEYRVLRITESRKFKYKLTYV